MGEIQSHIKCVTSMDVATNTGYVNYLIRMFFTIINENFDFIPHLVDFWFRR